MSKVPEVTSATLHVTSMMPFKTAVKCTLTGNIKTHVDLNIDIIKPYDELRNEIMAYAILYEDR